MRWRCAWRRGGTTQAVGGRRGEQGQRNEERQRIQFEHFGEQAQHGERDDEPEQRQCERRLTEAGNAAPPQTPQCNRPDRPSVPGQNAQVITEALPTVAEKAREIVVPQPFVEVRGRLVVEEPGPKRAERYGD